MHRVGEEGVCDASVQEVGYKERRSMRTRETTNVAGGTISFFTIYTIYSGVYDEDGRGLQVLLSRPWLRVGAADPRVGTQYRSGRCHKFPPAGFLQQESNTIDIGGFSTISL